MSQGEQYVCIFRRATRLRLLVVSGAHPAHSLAAEFNRFPQRGALTAHAQPLTALSPYELSTAHVGLTVLTGLRNVEALRRRHGVFIARDGGPCLPSRA